MLLLTNNYVKQLADYSLLPPYRITYIFHNFDTMGCYKAKRLRQRAIQSEVRRARKPGWTKSMEAPRILCYFNSNVNKLPLAKELLQDSRSSSCILFLLGSAGTSINR